MSQHGAEARVRELEDAFAAFTRMSSQLEDSYRALEDKVARLNDELAAARSERLRQLAEKEKIANRLERLLELLPGGVVVLDGDGIVRECNPAAVELLHQPLLGEPWRNIVEREFEPSNDGSEVTLASGRRVSISTRSLAPEAGQIVLLMDVTERYALQDMLNHHRRLSAMGEMAASLAHQVRTPLASALLYLGNLQNPGLNAEARQRFAAKAIDRLRHLEGMVGEMLRFARGGSFEMEDIDLTELLAEWEQTLRPQAEAGNASLSVGCTGSGPFTLQGNRDALLGALLNLGSNAIEAAGEAGRIEMELATTPDGGIVLRLTDNGSGIAPEDRERIFTPFYTTKSEGTGLGLAIVKVIVNAHQGRISVEDAPQGGACFVIRLPSASGQQTLDASATLRGSRDSLISMNSSIEEVAR